MTPAELLPLVSNLPKLENLAKLALCFGLHHFEDAKSLSILGCLQSCPLLTKFTLSMGSYRILYTQQSLAMVSALFSYLEPLFVQKLKVLELAGIVLNSSAGKALSRSLHSEHCNLITLQLSSCHFLSDLFKQLTVGIGENTSLQSIVLKDCPLGVTYFNALADALRENKTLKEVRISGTHLSIDQATVQALKQCNQKIAFDVE